VRELETRLTPSVTTIATFGAPAGTGPGSLVRDSSGNLYGVTQQGGTYGDGTIFEVAAGTGTITTLASFNGTDGQTPDSLMIDGSGNLYGLTQKGGSSNEGTVFEVAAGSGTINTLASFDVFDGELPAGSLALDSSGDLYGTATYTVWEVPAGGGVNVLASLNAGTTTVSGVVRDATGNLYGTTSNGGANSDGSVFEVALGSGTLTTLASFGGTNGAYPESGLVMDGSGNLYGTTSQGGPAWNPTGSVYGDGTVFELAAGGSAVTSLASFNGADGSGPGGLVMDGSGNLYGPASQGGASSDGTVWEVPAGSGAIATLASYSGTDGKTPNSVVLDGSGNLYGTTFYGPTSQSASPGTLFELSGAADTTDQWTGANSAVDTNWSDGANWSIGSAPYPTQTAVFTNNSSVQSFTSTVDAGFTNSVTGLNIDGTWGGTITVSSALAVSGNLTLASGTFGGNGAVTVGGSASQWTGGQIDVGAGGFTNTGVLTADTTGGNLVVSGAGTLTNTGTINEAGAKGLLLENNATLTNASGATFDLLDDGSISQSGGGTLTNAGTVEKTSGTGTSTIATKLSNTGTVLASSGTLAVSGKVTQVSGTTLTAGTWTVTGTAAVPATLDITSTASITTVGAKAKVTLTGGNAIFSNLSALSTIAEGGRFSLLGGESFTMTGALTNNGALTLGPGSVLTVGGSFTQSSTGSLTVQMGGTSTPTVGLLVSKTGTVSLAGSLTVTSTIFPALHSSFEILDNGGNSAIVGDFAGLPEGAILNVKGTRRPLRFRITYAGTDADGNHNVIIKRIFST
jgi:uncharacterized repeat protein (TIGR03803 family)